MILVDGTFLGQIEREREWQGEQWTETTAKLFGGKDMHYVRLGRGVTPADLPAEGDRVAFECSIKPYVTKAGKPGYELTAWAVVPSGSRRAAPAV